MILVIVQFALNAYTARDIRDVLTLCRSNTLLLADIGRLNSSLVSYLTGSEMDSFPQEIFETEDGRHSATSLKELMEKIKSDPNYRPTDQSEIDRLKELLEREVDKEKERDKQSPPSTNWNLKQLLEREGYDPNNYPEPPKNPPKKKDSGEENADGAK
jgi:hypothetical protein